MSEDASYPSTEISKIKPIWETEYAKSFPHVNQTVLNSTLTQSDADYESKLNSPLSSSLFNIFGNILGENSGKKISTALEVLRVNQLDAIRLDAEIYEVLNGQFLKMFEFFKPDIIERFKPELTALLEFLIFRLSVYSIDTTYGNSLQNLKYANHNLKPLHKYQKILFGLFTVGGRWLWSRLNRLSLQRDNFGHLQSASLFTAMNKGETVYKILSLFNFLLFLYDGRYVSLITRILSMRLIYRASSVRRFVSFEYMNRQLVWHGFTEFLMFVMPLINVEKIKNWVARTLSSPALRDNLPANACPICTRDPIQMPHIADCNHLFCYYCIKQNMLIDDKYSCPRCGTRVTKIQRWDMLNDPLKNIHKDDSNK